MSPRRAAAWRSEQAAFQQLLDLVEVYELDFEVIGRAITLCSLTLEVCEVVREVEQLEELNAASEARFLLERVSYPYPVRNSLL